MKQRSVGVVGDVGGDGENAVVAHGAVKELEEKRRWWWWFGTHHTAKGLLSDLTLVRKSFRMKLART